MVARLGALFRQASFLLDSITSMGLIDRLRLRKNAVSSTTPSPLNRALSLIRQGNDEEDAGHLQEALRLYLAATEMAPDLPKAHLNLGNVLLAHSDPHKALAAYARALQLQPDYAPAHFNSGNALIALSRYPEAIQCYRSALSADPAFVDAWVALGFAQQHLSDQASAVSSYLRALELKPDYAQVLDNLGVAYVSLSRYDQALGCFDRAITLEPDLIEARYHRALLHNILNNRVAAIADFDQVLSKNSTYGLAPGQRLHAKMHLCDWRDYEQQRALILQQLERGSLLSSCFPLLAITDSPRHQLAAGSLWARGIRPAGSTSPALPHRPRRDRIRVAYFSMDFNNHPVSFLTAGLFETHDRETFEIYGFSYGPPTRDEMRIRLEAAFDQFFHVADQSAQEIAALAKHLEIDIAVDLAGYTGEARPEIFAQRAAPIQINYLGYPATMGADFMDYMLVDPVTVPEAQREHYLEKLVFLPFFQVNDFRRLEPVKKFKRQDLGLPADAFVFCCFNHSYKITPEVFSCWMRILDQVPHSVLMLYAENELIKGNLCAEAVRAGVDPQRLVFGGRLSIVDYSSRYLEADLFLDTFPFNAGTTASDALWAGLPVLTCAGEAFASRMAASLLTALNLPELITVDLEAYEKQAVALASRTSLWRDLKSRLSLARQKSVLCDTQTFTRHLEQAYLRMVERLDAGLDPAELYLAH
jgi:predicted O-linked N-acetylglucosamine transferase (SPINDLY family)